jgi:hypothetical protein
VKKTNARTFFFALLGLAACCCLGCKTTRGQDAEYYHPRKQLSQWDEDYDHCRNASDELRKRAGGAREKGTSVEECMKAKGYLYGQGQIKAFREADFTFENDVTAEYFLMDGIYHAEALAKTRLDYLQRTSLENAAIRRTTGGTQSWWLILVGNYKELVEAKKARRELQREYGLQDIQIIKQEYGPRSRGELMLVP